MEDKLLKIITHYGVMEQLKHFQSEVFELNEAIVRHDNDCYSPDDCNEHIAEEIADCLVMINQFVEYYKLDKEQINIIMESKVDRQLDRIDKEDKEC